MGDTISFPFLQFERGRRAFKNGEVRPEQPSDDEQFTPKAWFWLGFMFERYLEFVERQRVMNLLGVSEKEPDHDR